MLFWIMWMNKKVQVNNMEFTFREQLEKDNAIFFNCNEFAEPHILNGHVINMVIDNDRLKEKSRKEYDGLYIGELLIIVPVKSVSFKLRQNMPITYDGKQMYIFDLKEDMGVYEIVLNQNMGG